MLRMVKARVWSLNPGTGGSSSNLASRTERRAYGCSRRKLNCGCSSLSYDPPLKGCSEAIFESFEDADSEEDEQDLLAKYRSITEAADATISGIADRTARNGDFDAKLEKWKRAIEDSSDEEDGTSPPTTGINGPSVTDSSSKLSPGAGTGREVPDTGNDRNSNDNDGDNDEDEDDGKLDTGVMTSQMRHFLIQASLPESRAMRRC